MRDESLEIEKIKRPLGISITIGCILFMTLLSLFLGIATHFAFKHSLYERYESYISDILNYVDRHIDDDDLEICTITLERSEEYDKLELFMDGIKEDFNIHYLYIVRPLAKTPTKNVMSVLSAENYHDRYEDTEGNLYLGWISDDEFDERTARKFFDVMKSEDIVFFEESTEWGYDYTGAKALYNSRGRAYSVLAVDVDITEIKKVIRDRTIEIFVTIGISSAIFILIFLLWARRNITRPILLLEKSVVAFAKKSHGQRSSEAFEFTAPDIHTENEVESLSQAVTQMTSDMRDYVVGIISAERKATMMSKLARKDALTGVRNKASYENEIKSLNNILESGELFDFGIAMIDLNFLKKINDNNGHEFGDIAIKKLCEIVCDVFKHSPVFRIGGDEFALILKGTDFENIESLVKEFNERLNALAKDSSLKDWERVSAAIGVASFDCKVDLNADDVFKRADQTMYENKKAMKAERKD